MFEYISNYIYWVLGYDVADPYEHDPNIISITKYLDSVNNKKNHKYYFDTNKSHLSH